MKYLVSVIILWSFFSCGNKGLENVLLEDQTIAVDGLDREYHLFIPSEPTNAPIVFLFHGNGSSHDALIGLSNGSAPYKLWLDIAENENIILAIPNGTLGSNGKRGWNDCREDASTNPDSDDVLFISSLIDYIIDSYLANSKRVYLAGTSNGGHLSIRLAEEIPEKITAFGAIVASNSANSKCINSNIPVSALIMNGTDDPILPYEGGEMASDRGEVLSTDETIQYWIDKNQTDTIAEIFTFEDINSVDDCTVERKIFRNGTNNTEVALYQIIDGGHNEPSIEERYNNLYLLLVGNQNADIEMANEVWSFFIDKTK